MKTMRLPREYAEHRQHGKFYRSLQPGQVVRWLRAKTAVYEIVDGKLYASNPGWAGDPQRGPFIELRRGTGKTFFAHLYMVRPAIIVTDQMPASGAHEFMIHYGFIELELDAAPRRELTTIRFPAMRDPFRDRWIAPANITVHFRWKREPRWFD